MAKAKNVVTKKSQGIDLSFINNKWFALSVLFIFWFLFFRELISGSAYLFDDFIEQYFPGKTFSSVSLANGIFPFWNPYTFGGMPLFADLQVAVLYPLNFILSFFTHGNVLSPTVIQFSIIVHYLLCSVFTFFLGRELKLSNITSLITALLFTYSSYMMIHMIHMPLVESLTWFPLILFLLLKFIDTKKYFYIFLCSAVVTLSILSGYPQVVFFSYFFIALYILTIFINQIKNKNYKEVLYIVFGFLIIVIIPFGLSAVQLLPANEFVSLSNRATFDYEFAKQGSLHPYDIFTFFIPKVFGVWSGNESITDIRYWSKHQEGVFMFSIANIFISVLIVVSIVPFIIYSLKEKKNKILTIFLLCFGLFSILFALGGNFFIQKLFFDVVPFFNRFRNPGHILFLFSFSVIIIFSLGFESLLNDSKILSKYFSKKYFITIFSIFTFILILIIAEIIKPGDSSNAKEVIPWVKKEYFIFFVFLVLFGLAFYLFINKKIKKEVFSLMIIVVLLFEIYLIWYEINNGSRNPEKLFAQNTQLINQLKEELKTEQFRINMRDLSGPMLFKRNQGLVDRIPLIEGYGALLMQRLYPFYKPDSIGIQSHNLLNVKYKINVDKQKNSMILVPNPGYLPRAKMFYDIKVIENDTASVRKYMESNEFDYRKTLVLEKNSMNISLPQIKDSLSFPVSSVKIIDYGLNKIVIEAETSENGFLYLSEVYYPAWKAYTDGKETEIYCTDYAMRSVYLEKGKHTVEFIYDSETFKTGKKITFAFLAFWFIGVLFSGFKFFRTKNTKK